MKKKKKILNSYTTRTFLFFAVIFGILLSFSAFNLYLFLTKNIDNNIFAQQQRDLIKNKLYLNELFSTSSTKLEDISLYMSNYEMIPQRNRRLFFNSYLNDIIKNQNNIYGLWVVFKPFSIDRYDNDYKNYDQNITGQYAISYYKIREQIIDIPANINDYKKLDKYLPMITTGKKLLIIAPIKDPNTEMSGNKYMIRLVNPIIASGRIIGIVGIDLNLSKLNNFFNKKGEEIFILDKNMNIIFSNHTNYINSKLDEVYKNLNTNNIFRENFSTQKAYTSKGFFLHPREKSYYSLDFLNVKKTTAKLGLLVSYSSTLHKKYFYKYIYKILLVPALVFLILSSLVFILLQSLSNFFREVDNNLDYLLKKEDKMQYKDRKGAELKNIQSLLKRNRQTVKKYIQFTDIFLQENYDQEIKIDKEDALYENLEKLRTKLQENRKKSIEQLENQEKEAQISKAIAKINDLQREHINDIEQLSYNTIKYICDFTKAVQGGFYVINTETNPPILELISFYSYNRKVYRKNKIEIGEGLAGTCAIEKKRIYTKVPPDYLEITSGLGEKAPNFILLLPLIHNENLYGIIELAFLDSYDKHFDNFFDSSTSIIASTIATAKNTEQTKRLLEETKNISQEMQEKEKSLEIQIKELERLKEKSLTQRQDLDAILNSVNRIEYFAEFDLRANVMTINNNLSEKLQVLSSDATLLTYYDIFMISDRQRHERYWKEVLQGKSVEYEMGVFLGKYNLWFKAILTPVFNHENEIYKVLFFGIDFSELKKREQELQQLTIELNEKAEQISVQEIEMDDFFIEYQEMTEQAKVIETQLEALKTEKQNLEKSMEFLQKEFQKRVTRSKRIELNLKKRIKSLEQELKEYRDKNKE